ncbi:D-alanyl-D-alanine carboxypeptidase [Phocea massiliensis]|uniref:serine-type D-Ala-D-Ala carboxypeptidase n=1 Tax=Merdimmobilis hominis TaxID=2897707 RepID=A0A938X4W4_9FIRM|nr:D-alanyl-D-alanine carboxypeptidase family protein [Merdimmobilis hominis]MBM6919574.1 D-alanyl-D-alanine carboxypeptidase [Merdimmobilis hominis]
MRQRLISFVICFSLFVAGVRVSAGDSISAKAYLLMDAATGKVLAAKNETQRLPIASTTKIMTALLALEQPNVKERFCVDADAIRVEGSSMGLLPGDEVSLYDLAGGMLSASGNDAANAAAVRIGGDLSSFAQMMNDRAASLSMEDTHFVTPSGLHDDEHYSTVKDLALLAREALQNPMFRSLCSQSHVTLYYGNPPYYRTLMNHNRLLSSYEGCIGVKTGYTKTAGRCLVSAAERDGVTLICVTLSAPNDWEDHKTLLDRGFRASEPVTKEVDVSDVQIPVVGGTQQTITVRAASTLTACLSETEWQEIVREIECPPFLYAPVQKGDYIGDAVYTYRGNVIGRIPLIAASNTAYHEESPSFFDKILQFLKAHIRIPIG